MKPYLLLFSLLGLLFGACQPSAATETETTALSQPVSGGDSLTALLFQSQCLICHGVGDRSHEELLAPPIEAVKRRYQFLYPERDSFIAEMTRFTLNPTAEEARMYGAVSRFKLMPKLAFQEAHVRQISAYIFDEEMEKPGWFEAHFLEQHPDGIPDPGPAGP
ncbi:MAG: hypothetical protein D6722_23650 [Bacteroidetes bacterium]|nr:MAG: hypothetical protein D6722_23650 [Bacteroidota bacterium]